MHLNVFVSQECFSYCSGCYSFSREEKNKQYLSTDIIIKFLKYAFEHGIHKVTLCGGDPLTRNDIFDLLLKIKKIGYYISLDTLGTIIIKDMIVAGRIVKKIDVKKFVNLVDMIGIPIDGSDDKTINYFRNSHDNIFKEQLSICDELNRYNANICINTVVNKGNLDDAKKISSLINKMNYVKKWQFFQFIPSGKYGFLNRKKFEITNLQFLQFKNEILENVFRNKDRIEFKSIKMRNSLYSIIDNSGNVWISKTNEVELNNRKIIGNIKNVDDWEKICLLIKKKRRNLQLNKKVIIAIGGGENGRILDDGTKTTYETEKIDEEIVKVTNKKNPKFLFICHAMSFSEEVQDNYYKIMKNIYEKKYNCVCKILKSSELENKNYVESIVEWADIIYEGGGDTFSMLKLWEKTGFDNILYKAWNKGKIICGISAGAVCWFKSCISEISHDEMECLKCLNWIGLHVTPHCNEIKRRQSTKAYLKKSNDIGIMLSNGAAIEIIDNKYKILISTDDGYCIKSYWINGKYIQKQVNNKKNYKNINNLLSKSY